MNEPRDEPYEVPDLQLMWFNVDPPVDVRDLHAACPHCGEDHHVADMAEASGPLARTWSCPNAPAAQPIISISREGEGERDGWTIVVDPRWRW